MRNQGGSNTFNDPAIRDLGPVALELDVTAAEIGDRSGPSLELGVGLGVQYFRTGIPDYSLALWDIDATWRFVPVRFARFEPYLGAGFGFFMLQSTDIIDTCPVGYYCFAGTDEDFQDSFSKRLASGFNPHVVAGFNVPFNTRWKLVAEAVRESHKRDGTFDFGTTRFMLGIGWRPSRK